MLLVFALLPKTSWINLTSTPNNFKLSSFSGEYVLTTGCMKLNNGVITNVSETKVLINDKTYKLKKGELVIQCTEDELIKDIIKDEPFPDIFSNSLFFDIRIKVDAYKGNDEFINGNIQIKRLYSIYKKDINIGLDVKNDEDYSITIIPNQFMKSSLLINNDTKMTTNSNMRISICGDTIIPNDGTSIIFSSIDSREVGMLFDFTTDMVEYCYLDDNDYCYLLGECSNFSGKSDGNNSVLKQTYLNEQKNYDVGLLVVEGTANDIFQLEYELSDQFNCIQVLGLSKSVEIANNPINYNFPNFLSENLASIITGIFAAFIASYIPISFELGREKRD